MAHNLNYNNGEHSFFSVKEKAWHGLGKIVYEYPTSQEAIIYAGLNYEVVKRPIFTYDTYNAVDVPGDNTPKIPELKINNFFATVRKDTDQILGIVGSKYEIVQNETAFTFFDSLVNDGSGIQYETAGALGSGEKIFITAKIPNVIKVGRKDIIEEYVFLTTSHDGSGSITAAFTPVRIVCNNTLNAALRTMKNAVYIKHTANAEQKLKEAARIIAISQDMSKDLETLFNKWAKVRVTDSEVKKLIQLAMSPNAEVFKTVVEGGEVKDFSTQFQNITNKVFEYAMSAESQTMDTTQNTLFGVYNAVTGYYQNVKDYKSESTKVESIMWGTAAEKTSKAFDLCLNASQYLS